MSSLRFTFGMGEQGIFQNTQYVRWSLVLEGEKQM